MRSAARRGAVREQLLPGVRDGELVALPAGGGTSRSGDGLAWRGGRISPPCPVRADPGRRPRACGDRPCQRRSHVIAQVKRRPFRQRQRRRGRYAGWPDGKAVVEVAQQLYLLPVLRRRRRKLICSPRKRRQASHRRRRRDYFEWTKDGAAGSPGRGRCAFPPPALADVLAELASLGAARVGIETPNCCATGRPGLLLRGGRC